MGYVNVYEVSEGHNTSDRTTGVTDSAPSGIDLAIAEFSRPRRRRSPRVTQVWRVRGWKGEAVVHSRVYQRRHPAVQNLEAASAYYDRVTLEVAEIGAFTEVEVPPWW